MLYLYHHHCLNRLAELLSVLLERQSRDHVLAPDTIVVPDQGVGRWLQMQLAEDAGIAANLDLPLLARFIWNQVPRILPGAPESREFARDRLQWHLHALLPALARDQAEIAGYLQHDEDGLQAFQLAERLADVFDQYMVYRPAMLERWADAASPSDWQARVWQVLLQRLGTTHRGHLLHQAIRHCEQQAPASPLPPTLYCFGLGAMPPDYVRFLYAMARHCDLHLLITNPCAHYWGDIQNATPTLAQPLDAESPLERELDNSHPLLARLGRGTRDLLRVLYSSECQEVLEPELGQALAYSAPARGTLLGRVQADIIQLDLGSPAPDPADASVQVHACHGPLREVQVLHDQLLDLLIADPSLHPREILVLLPQPQRHAAAIRSVFGTASADRCIPWTLADHDPAATHPVIHAFNQIVHLPLSRCPLSELMDLAAMPPIRRRFGLSPADIDRLRDWLADAGVRWGRNASHRASLDADAGPMFTWEFGLDRLLLGLCQQDPAVVDGVAPWPELEGRSGQTLGQFWALLQRLWHWQTILGTSADASDWQQRLSALLDEWFPEPADDAESAAVQLLHGSLGQLSTATECRSGEDLSPAVVRRLLGQQLGLAAGRSAYLSGGVTFAGMDALRGVPFRVVCLLGMDEGEFPRQGPGGDFNRLRQAPQLGDLSQRADDQLRFLQALMAARDVFYVSYTGQDVSSGDQLPPSTTVAQWLDFLREHYLDANAASALVTDHPMQAFSARYQGRPKGNRRIFTFASEWLPRQAGRVWQGWLDDSRLPAAEIEVVELAELLRFFAHPPRYFLQGQLQAELGARTRDQDDAEPLELAGLSLWRLRDALLAAGLHADLPATPDDNWRARGLLPPPPLDLPAWRMAAQGLEALLPTAREWARMEGTQSHAITLSIGGRQLRGSVAQVHADALRRLRPGRLSGRFQLQAWVEFLALRQSGWPGRLELAGLRNDRLQRLTGALSDDQATAHLQDLISIFLEGRSHPVLLHPELSGDYQLQAQETVPDQALDKLNAALQADKVYQPRAESDDPWLAGWLERPPALGAAVASNPFCTLSDRVFGPLQSALQEPHG